MKRNLVRAFLLVSILASCKPKHDPGTYFSKSEQDSLLADIITYVYVRPKGTSWDERFERKHRKYYVQNLPKFSLEKMYRSEDGTFWYFIIRPARSPIGTQRGVGGCFKLDDKNTIVKFREVYNTPVFGLDEIKLKGEELYLHMIKKGNVDDYLLNDAYLEWPNAWTYYDTIRYEWLSKPGL